jgi:hypothetical protein
LAPAPLLVSVVLKFNSFVNLRMVARKLHHHAFSPDDLADAVERNVDAGVGAAAWAD